MIEVQLMSRMGNHFFQYAFAYATARHLDTTFRIRDWHRSPLTSLVEAPSTANKPYDKYLDILFRRKLQKRIIAVENEPPFPLEDDVLYRGYFQSESFFHPYESEIRKEFNFKPSVLQRFKNQYGKLFEEQEVLCVHIRRSDYADVNLPYLGGGSLILPLDYYRENIQQLAGPDTLVYFVSDDIEYVEQQFKLENPNYRFSTADHFTDFLLLAHAHKVIIANSSYSWWAAFLNKQPNKKVIAPKYYLGFKVKQECPQGIMYPGFDWVDVPFTNQTP